MQVRLRDDGHQRLNVLQDNEEPRRTGRGRPETEQISSSIYSLWETYKKLLKMAIEIVDLAINSMVIFHRKL